MDCGLIAAHAHTHSREETAGFCAKSSSPVFKSKIKMEVLIVGFETGIVQPELMGREFTGGLSVEEAQISVARCLSGPSFRSRSSCVETNFYTMPCTISPSEYVL